MGLFKLTKQDKDYQALQDMLSPKEDQGEETTTTGILSKPDTKKEEDEESTFLSFFGNVFDRSKSQAEEISRMMQEEAERSALEVRLSRQTAGITRSLPTETANKRYNEGALSGPMKLAPKALEEPVPVDVEELETPKESTDNERQSAINRMLDSIFTSDSDTTVVTDDADGGAAPSGKGLMSKPYDELRMREENEPLGEGLVSPDAGMLRPRARPSQATLAGKQYGTAVAEMAVDLEKTEGNMPHIGADWDNVTLALGIVPSSGLKIDGKKVPSDRAERGKWLKSNGYVDKNNQPTAKFKKAKIDTSNVSKDGINRKDYASDTEWSAAVINKFKSYGEEAVENFDSLGVKEQKVIIDFAWNMGGGALSYTGNKTLINELKKPPEDRVVANMLEAGKHAYEGGRAMRGLARRKALTINEVIEKPAEKISQIRQLSFGNDTYHTYINAKGEEVKTIKLNRKHIKSPDGVIDVATGDEILSQSDLDYSSIVTSPRSRPNTVVASN